jgi:hypothetical protein
MAQHKQNKKSNSAAQSPLRCDQLASSCHRLQPALRPCSSRPAPLPQTACGCANDTTAQAWQMKRIWTARSQSCWRGWNRTSWRCGGCWDIGKNTRFAFAGEWAAAALGRQLQASSTIWTRFRLPGNLWRNTAIMVDANAALGFAAAAAADAADAVAHAAAAPRDQMKRRCVDCDQAVCELQEHEQRAMHLRPMMIRCPELGPAVTSSV